MRHSFLSSWPLFLGLSLIMIGNGLQGTLLGIRASNEQFDTIVIGILMSLYYFGYLCGSIYSPLLISKVGHIRVFAAFASLASAMVLLHALYPNPYFWGFVRFISGFSYAGLYLVVESWLNSVATNKTRGRLLATYMAVSYAGLLLGQFFLNFGDPMKMELFVMASILLSLALLPISLINRSTPHFEMPERIKISRLYIMSPLGIVGVFIGGTISGTYLGLGGMFGSQSGLSLQEISIFMASIIFGGVILQYPIGALSDIVNRRHVIIFCALCATIFAFFCATYTGGVNATYLFFAFAFGACSLPLYALSIAHTNDHISPQYIVAASASLIFVSGVGSCIGPLLVSGLMHVFGTNAFFYSLCALNAVVVLFSIYRMFIRVPVPSDEKVHFASLPHRATPLVAKVAEEYISAEDDPPKTGS